jgi:hypothetical protein
VNEERRTTCEVCKSDVPACPATMTVVIDVVEATGNTTYRCTKPAGHPPTSHSGLSDTGANLAWTVPS